MNQTVLQAAVASVLLVAGLFDVAGQPAAPSPNSRAAEQWRAEHRLIDLHQHIDFKEDRLARAVRIMNAAGVGIAVNLSGGVVTHTDGEISEFERNKQLADRLYPGRYVHYLNLDYKDWNEPNFSERAATQIDEGHRLGAAGFKEYKRLGLYLRDKEGKLIKIDDPKLDAVWKRCGELNLPVSIHVADPKAFWLPYNDKNERWKELKDHRSWWFGDPNIYPAREELLEALNRVIARHPKTTFVCVHFANNAEDLEWVDAMLDRFPNMMADLAARIPEIGRHSPERVRQLFIKHQNRILFATDFQVYDVLTLGSGGSGPPPTDEDAKIFFAKHWRWMETYDPEFEHMTPIQGDWTINAIGLPDSVLRKIYFDNARKLLASSLPLPTVKAPHISGDFTLRGNLSEPAWQEAPIAHLESVSLSAEVRPELSGDVHLLWSDKFLYLGYKCPFMTITEFKPAQRDKERFGLWEKDVVEVFIASDPSDVRRYSEYEVAPNGEKLDVMIAPEKKDFEWSSGFRCTVDRDETKKVWTAEMRIPLANFGANKPRPGLRWRINLYRCDYANGAFLAWNPTLSRTFHTPERFGWLEFGE